MQPGSVYESALQGDAYYGRVGVSPARVSSPRSMASDEKRRADFYARSEFRGAAGVKTMHQTGINATSEPTLKRSASAPPGRHSSAGDREVNSGLGHTTKAVAPDAFAGAHGSTTPT